MPAFDGTGPNGLGAMTGRGFGYCHPGRGRNERGQVLYGAGRGGIPRGGGRGFAHGGGHSTWQGGGRGRWAGRFARVVPPSAVPDIPEDQEIRMLKEQTDMLLGELEQMKARLDTLTSEQ